MLHYTPAQASDVANRTKKALFAKTKPYSHDADGTTLSIPIPSQVFCIFLNIVL